MKLTSLLLFPLRRRSRNARNQIELRKGIIIISPPEEELLQIVIDVCANKCYAPEDAWITSACTIVDIGAHVGVFTLLVACKNPSARIIALEPSIRMCDFLRENISQNNIHNVTVLQAACGGQSGERVLYARGLEWGNSLYSHDMFGSEFRPLLKTPVLTLQDLFERFEVLNCDLLKLNCEGAEYEILLNACDETLKKVQKIALQYHIGLTDHSPAQLSSFLRSHGFVIRCLPQHSEEGGFLYAFR